MLVIERAFWDLYWLYLLFGTLCLYLARKRPGLSWGDAGMVILAILAGTCAGVAALCSVPPERAESNFLFTFPWLFELPYLGFAALTLAALRVWKKRSNPFDFLLLLGCVLPFARIALLGSVLLFVALFAKY